MINGQSPFRSEPRMSEAKFVSILAEHGSFQTPLFHGIADPTAAAHAIYKLIVQHGHDPAVWLAICNQEHSLGTNPDSVLHRMDTRSWTNARTVRHPEVRGTRVFDPQRRSYYVRYANVIDSVKDGLYRVDEEGFAYDGLTTIQQIFNAWLGSPGMQSIRTLHYVASVTGFVNRYGDLEGEPVGAQISFYEWRPAASDHYEAGRDEAITRLIYHHTNGYNSLPWLTHTSDPPVSAHFLVRRRAPPQSPGYQLVAIEDTAWTTGDANEFSVGVEYERKWPEQPDIPEGDYEVLAQLGAAVIRYVDEHGLGHIPATRAGVNDHNDYMNTECPANLDVDRIATRIAEILAEDKDGQSPDSILFHKTGAEIKLGFLDHFLEVGKAVDPDNPVKGGIAVFGYPRGNEYPTSFGAAQEFGRYFMEWHRDNAPPFDIIGSLRGKPVPEEVGK